MTRSKLDYLKDISKLLLPTEKKYLLYFLFLTIISSLLEILSIGIIVPIIYLFTNKEALFSNKLVIILSNFLGLETEYQIIFTIIFFLISVFFFKSFFFTFNFYLQKIFYTNLNVRLVKTYFKSYIYSPWSFIMNKNTGTLIRNLQLGIDSYSSKIIPYLLNLVTEVIMSLSLAIFVFYLYPFISTIVFSFLIVLGYITQRITKSYDYRLGSTQSKQVSLINKHIIESFRIPKLLKIMGKENKVIDIFEDMSLKEKKAKYTQLFIEKLPRIWIEFVFLSLIVFALIFFLNFGTNLNELFTLLIIFSLVGYRMLPSLNKILLSIQNLRYSTPILNILLNEYENFKTISKFKKLDQEDKKIDNHSISLQGVSFQYEGSKEYIFKDFNLNINKNASIAIMGKSGVGKSTLGDLMMGLIEPSKGQILIGDYKIQDVKSSWLKCIGYVPQETYILDDTLKANIALGVDKEKIDIYKIEEIISLLELDKIVERTEFNSELILGDNGVKLSGGQKQRIGIGRALYTNPKILVLDEATSFLDLETEKKIISIFEKLKNKITIICITHRKSAAIFCDEILDLNKLTNEKS
tara:strand:+ start:444 stop:2186 length:1743 start_codon:yes stop_codon:yes gene_type:complete